MNRADKDGRPAEPPDVVAAIDEAAHSVQIEGVAGAAVRSMVISAVVVGGLVWLWQMFLRRQFGGKLR
ncbi:MAG: hypothetical protein HZB53_12715 [Chloroflexi bacterium]|nr:hypothetical protein [Chloroflexota bacterium]